MARNKITFNREYENGRWEYTFTGSVRQPTLVEINNFIAEKRLYDGIDDYFGIAVVQTKAEEYVPPEDALTVTLYGYDGGCNDGSCPVCGRERDFSKDYCPVCERRWS